MKLRIGALVLGIALTLPPKGVAADTFAVLEAHLSLISDVADRALLEGTFGYGLRAGMRWTRVDAFVHVEHNAWVATEYDVRPVLGALNAGVGVAWRFLDDVVRTSVAAGPSVLLTDTPLDRAGAVGLFVDLRPLGLRWRFNRHTVLGCDPLTFSLVAPVLRRIPLVMREYRSQFYVEFTF